MRNGKGPARSKQIDFEQDEDGKLLLKKVSGNFNLEPKN